MFDMIIENYFNKLNQKIDFEFINEDIDQTILKKFT